MKQVVFGVILTLTGCGFNGTQRFETNDSNQGVTFSGTGSVDINLTFIQQLIDLCRDSLLPSSYGSLQLYNQAVAQCVLNSTAGLTPKNNPLCQPGADLSGFPPDQQQSIIATCLALGGGH